MSPDENPNRIAAWMSNPAGYVHAAEALAVCGERAIGGLRHYLRGGPQVIPQPRCFAVAMLARIPVAAATDGLREVLRMHPLKTLEPVFAESEYVVKSDALDALVRRSTNQRNEDVALGMRERLRVAVVATGALHISALTGALTDVLDDDVLADAAVESLATLGQGTARAITPRLDAWASEAAFSARRRLALIRALRVLHRTAACPEPASLRRLLNDAHPEVRAASALLAWSARHDPEIVDALVHGAAGFDRELAFACRNALGASADADVVAMATRALQRNAEPDLYGDLHPLTSEAWDWLSAFIARSSRS